MHQMSAITKVFETLELLHLVADDLSQHDLALCCLVNKGFSAAFNPLLWHSLTIHPQDLIPKFQTPEGRAGLLRNGHLIRVLRTHNLIALEPFVEYGITCTNLVSLDVNHSVHHFTRDVIRSSEMLSKGRRKGSIGTGQKQISRPSMFSATAPSAGSALFGASRPASSGFFGAPTPTGFGQAGTSASVTARFGTPRARLRSHAELQRDGETYLVSILERNPRLEFLVVPSHCLDCEAIVRIAGVSLLSLKEFYSDTDLWRPGHTTDFTLREHSTMIDTGNMFVGPEAGMKVRGCFQTTGDELLHPLLNNYPRLRRLQMGVSASVNRDILERIRFADRNFTHMEITYGRPSEVAQVLSLAPPLKHLSIGGDLCVPRTYALSDDTIKDDFLRHAPTLEHLEIGVFDHSREILQALLCAAPSLRTLKTMAEDLGYQPCKEVEMDALQIISSPWTCTQMEAFECKILNVPRPDIVNTPFVTDFFNPGLPPGPPLGPAAAQDNTSLTGAMLVAQQESHAVQRQVLRQLGRLTHLRALRLGRYGRDWDNVEYSRLEIRGIRTMVVDAYTDRNCLELSLESGLDELRELRELEKLEVSQMAHRIGLAEVQWMAEHWPRLKSIGGLLYRNYDCEVYHGDEVEGVGSQVESVPEHFRWMRENRPDIKLS